MVMNTAPAALLTILGIAANTGAALFSLIAKGEGLTTLALSAGRSLLGGYGLMLLVGAVTLLTEWRRIPCTAGKKLWYLLFFPLFMYTYIPILAAALFQKVEWKPIRHDCTRTLEQLRQQNPKSRSAPASGSSERRFSEDRPSPFCR